MNFLCYSNSQDAQVSSGSHFVSFFISFIHINIFIILYWCFGRDKDPLISLDTLVFCALALGGYVGASKSNKGFVCYTSAQYLLLGNSCHAPFLHNITILHVAKK